MTESESIGSRLEAVHNAVIDEPLPERLEEASCGPAVKHIAHLALHTADAGGTPDEWRAWVSIHVPEVSAKLLAETEECMHDAGLWPWNG